MRCPGGRTFAGGAIASDPGWASCRMRVDIDMRLDEIGKRVETDLELRRFLGLHETQVPFGQDEIGFARQRADDGQVRLPRALRMTKRTWRALPTRLRMTPAIVTPSRKS